MIVQSQAIVNPASNSSGVALATPLLLTSGGAVVSPPLPPGDAAMFRQVNNNCTVSSISIVQQPHKPESSSSSSYCCILPRLFTQTVPFPKVGIKVSFFKEFIESCGGREELVDLSTTDVCNNYVKPKTESTKESYCNYLLAGKSDYVKAAKVFVSHAWKYKFLDVVEALEYNFRDALDTVLWFDLFSNNQHIAVNLNYDWWCGTFKSAIGAFKHTVMVMAPWNDPIPLTRGWCLFELYCTVETNSKFDIAMSKRHRTQFLMDMQSGVEKQINKMLTTINAENSECFKPEDKEQIFAVVKETVGFDKINALVFEKMRDWVVEVTEMEFRQQGAGTEEFLVYQSMLADIYFNQGRYDDALPLYSSCYEARAGTLGTEDPKTLESQFSMARVRHARYESLIVEMKALESNQIEFKRKLPPGMNQWQKKEAFKEKCDELRNLTASDQHVAESLYKNCLRVRRSILGSSDPLTLEAISSLARLLSLTDNGKRAEAESLLLECRDITNTSAISDEALHLDAMTNLGLFYISDAAESTKKKGLHLLVESLELHKSKLKPDHPKTLKVMSHVGSCGKHYHLLNVNDANSRPNTERMLFQCLQRQLVVLGTGHLDTRETTAALLKVLDLPERPDGWELLANFRMRRNKILDLRDRLHGEYGVDPELWKVIERILVPMLRDVSENQLRAKLLLDWVTYPLILFHFIFSFPLAFVCWTIWLLTCAVVILPYLFLICFVLIPITVIRNRRNICPCGEEDDEIFTPIAMVCFGLGGIFVAGREILYSCLLLPVNAALVFYWLYTNRKFGTFVKPIHLFLPWFRLRPDWDDCTEIVLRGSLSDWFAVFRALCYLDYVSYMQDRELLFEGRYPFILYE